jgi:hypothetical protein
MATGKKKSGKQKKRPQGDRHYCRICGEYKANEKFSGKGHATHICKACAKKSPAQKSEDITINRLHGMALRYLSESEIKWLKNRRNDNRSEVQELAREIFEMKFPRQARNEIKQKLHIQNIVFHVRGEIFDGDGCEHFTNVEFTAETSGKIIRKSFDGDNGFIEEKSIDIGVKGIKKLFNVAVHNYDISFWEADFCRGIYYDPDFDIYDFEDDDSDESEQLENNGDDELDDRTPTWSVAIKYKNETEQNTKGYDSIPYPAIELFEDFEGYFFDEDLSENDFDEDDIEADEK